ncbi:Bank1 [Phodopus roborovskii]|uniref:Bank1 protein n=1 Tax=Phodopus roborovskii TaxID=109678 RepID=A0AAU9ZB98_PHORO|nr:Bank1 [Phodopus roborovskii]
MLPILAMATRMTSTLGVAPAETFWDAVAEYSKQDTPINLFSSVPSIILKSKKKGHIITHISQGTKLRFRVNIPLCDFESTFFTYNIKCTGYSNFKQNMYICMYTYILNNDDLEQMASLFPSILLRTNWNEYLACGRSWVQAPPLLYLPSFQIQNFNRNNEQENDYEDDVTSLSTYPPSAQSPAFHHELRKTHSWSTDRCEEPDRAGDTKEEEPSAEAGASLQEVGGDSSENQYDDLYVFIPGIDAECNAQEPLPYCRPPLPPPRPGTAASQLERPHLTSQGKMMEDQVGRSQNWSDLGERQETREEPGKEERREGGAQKAEGEEENPYTFAETDDNEYDLILASKSVKKRTGNRSFIINRPPAPTPRPTPGPFKEETTPYIAQDKARTEGPTFSSAKGYVTTGQEELILGQEELILLQEKVKNGKMSMDEALEKFKRWQLGKSSLEMIQQEKIRQLRDSIVGKRPEDENAYDKLTIVHHPSGNTAHNENILHSSLFNNKPKNIDCTNKQHLTSKTRNW